MKKLILPFALLTSNALGAQITLTQNDAMVAGDQFIMGTLYSAPIPLTIGNAGPSQNWNFSSVVYDYRDTLDVYAASWISAIRSTPFPQCQLAVGFPNDTTYYDMVRVDANGLYVEGASVFDYTYGVVSRYWQNAMSFVEWPSTYNTISVDTAFSDFTYPTSGQYDSIRDVLTYVTNFDYDAWGTVTTPMGTYSCLRVKRLIELSGLQYYHDTILGWQAPFTYSNSDTQYEWWVNGIGFPVMRMMVAANDSVVTYQYLISASTGITTVQAQDFSLYPNPANQYVTVTGAINSRWEIVDALGRAVKTGTVNDDVMEINIEELANGIYVMNVTDERGIRSSRKFIVE